MKKTQLLNAQLSQLIARLGHTDALCIADAGLPIPLQQNCVDLALTAGIPSFLDTLAVVLSELFIEAVVLAEEIQTQNPSVLQEVEALLQEIENSQRRKIRLEFVAHEQFKRQSQGAKGVVRTGEFSPYANILLYSGVPF